MLPFFNEISSDLSQILAILVVNHANNLIIRPLPVAR